MSRFYGSRLETTIDNDKQREMKLGGVLTRWWGYFFGWVFCAKCLIEKIEKHNQVGGCFFMCFKLGICFVR